MKYQHEVDKYLENYIKEWGFSGVVCIVKDDKIKILKESGFACLEHNVKNTFDTCFSLASISKQFTAFSIMQLVDKDKIDLNESANKYLHDFYIDSRITIHHLLSHSSGLHNFYNFDDDFFGIYNRNTYSKKEYFDKFFDFKLEFEPGTQYDYNNANYNLLAWIVENISGVDFDKYLKENIFLPLGMKNSALDIGTNILPNKAFPYDFDRQGIVKSVYYNEKFSIGSGAVVSNCSDLILWHNCMKRRALLSKQSYDLFFSVNLNNYCYGIENYNIHNHNCYSHGGDHFGVMTYMANFFDDDLTIIILSNCSFGNQYKMRDALYEIIFTGRYEIPQKPQAVKLTNDEIKKYEGVYLDNKIELRQNNEKWEFVRFNGELHIPIYPVGNHQFSRVDSDQYNPYTLKECTDGSYEFFGYKKNKSDI